MWKFQHAVECDVRRDFAWRFWTDVENWLAVDPSVESVKLHGTFNAGTKGITKPRGLAPIEWQLTEVQEQRRAVIEVPASGAVMRCLWSFEDSGSRGTRITQELTIEGPQADDYARTIGLELEKGVPQGMRRLAEAITKAAGNQA